MIAVKITVDEMTIDKNAFDEIATYAMIADKCL